MLNCGFAGVGGTSSSGGKGRTLRAGDFAGVVGVLARRVCALFCVRKVGVGGTRRVGDGDGAVVGVLVRGLARGETDARTDGEGTVGVLLSRERGSVLDEGWGRRDMRLARCATARSARRRARRMKEIDFGQARANAHERGRRVPD